MGDNSANLVDAGQMPPQRREHRQGRQAHHPGIRRRDNLPGQGIRIVRLQACNADGCSGPATTYAPVIINILGHAAVRVWHTGDALEADWDQIPAIRVVEYRLITDHAEWKTSPVRNRARVFPIHRRPCRLRRRRPSHHPRLLQLQRRRRKARLAWPLPDQHI